MQIHAAMRRFRRRAPRAAYLLLFGLAVWAATGREVVLRRRDLEVTWAAREGVRIRYRGVPVFVPLLQPVTIHPPDWSTAYYRSADVVPTVEQRDEAGVTTLVCTYSRGRVALVETLRVGPGEHCRFQYSLRQDAWTDALVQLGLPRPAPEFWVGSQFTATTSAGVTRGIIPLVYDSAVGSHPFADATDVLVSSISGRLRLRSDKPLVFWDYPRRPQGFFLGVDEALPRGKKWTVAVDLDFSPARFEQGGVLLHGLVAPAEVDDGVFRLELSLGRAPGGPARVTAELSLQRDGEEALSTRKECALTPAVRSFRLALPVSQAGRYRVRVRLTNAAGKTCLELPPRLVAVKPLLRIEPARLPLIAGSDAALLVRVSPGLAGRSLLFEAHCDGVSLQSGHAVAAGRLLSVPIAVESLPMGSHLVAATLKEGDRLLARASTRILRAPPRKHAVIIDNRTRGLLVDGLPFLPFGFYCISPMGNLPEIEVTQGFTHIAPYQSRTEDLAPEQMQRIRAAMDRCAALGMKVHYDIRTLAQAPPSPEKWKRLRREVEAFRDHPALLCWYLCDEPAGQGIAPAVLDEAYAFVKKLDPYHPITMVFCMPERMRDYSKGMDIVMADPYPIPNRPVTLVSDWTDMLNRAVDFRKPLWIVPQAFGGGEGWAREPSAREERAMTYLALIHGATGIQYFIRRPPIGNPISSSLWSECRRLALEAAEMTPWLLSPEAAPALSCSPLGIHVLAKVYGGDLLVLAVNARNQPVNAVFTLQGVQDSASARLVFENREVPVEQGVFRDMIDAFGTRVYRLSLKKKARGDVGIEPGNLTRNPSFELAANVGTPDGCYVGVGGDPGASLFVDPRVARHGRHSLRVTTPREGQGLTVLPFPVPLLKGRRYRLSLWSKAASPGPEFDMSVRGLQADPVRVRPSGEWTRTVLSGMAPATLRRGGIELHFIGPGVVWLDLLQLTPIAGE